MKTERAAGLDETPVHRGAWLLLLFALGFIALDIAQVAYRFTLPTEGWVVNTRDLGADTRDFPMDFNVVGAPSPMRSSHYPWEIIHHS